MSLTTTTRLARWGLLGAAAGLLADPWPWDINAQIQSALYNLLRFLTNVIFALDDALLGAARATLMLRNAVVEGGAHIIGSLFTEMAPVITVALFMVFMAAVVWYASRFLFVTQVTTAERFVLVLLLATYLMANGVYAVQWVEFLRRGLGHTIYNVSFTSIREWINPAGGVLGVDPDCDLSHDDPDTALCNGYEFAMSYLRFTDEEQVWDFSMPQAFRDEYFRVAPIDFPNQSAGDRDALLAKAEEAPLQALGGIPLAIMAVLEEIVRFLLALALLASFVGLAVALIFGAFLPLGGVLNGIVQQIVRLFVTTAVVELVLGLFGGLLWVAQSNAVLFLSCGVLMLLADLVMVFQCGSLVLRSVEGTLLGSARLGGPEMLRGGGFDQVSHAASAVRGALGGHSAEGSASGSQEVPASLAYAWAGGRTMPGGGASTASSGGGSMGAVQQAMNTAQPVMSPSGHAASAAAGGQSGHGASVPAAAGTSSSGVPASGAGHGTSAGPVHGARVGSSGATSASYGASSSGVPSGAAVPTASPAAMPASAFGAPSAPAAAPVAPVFDADTGLVRDPASGREMSIEEYAASGGGGPAAAVRQPGSGETHVAVDEGVWPAHDWPATPRRPAARPAPVPLAEPELIGR